MKILLINPITYGSIDTFIEDSKRMKINTDEPIGLMYLAAKYIKEGHDAEILDLQIETLKYRKFDKEIISIILQARLNKFKPDMVGISFLYELNKDCALWVAQRVKEYDSNIKTIAGGLYASMMDELPYIDEILKGDQTPNWMELKPYRDNLLIGEYGILGRTVIDRVYKENCRVATIQISRGCPCKCTYCSGHAITKRKYTHRPVNDITEEIKELKEKYDIEVFIFNEENNGVNLKKTKELYKALIPLDIKWISNAGFYVSNMDQEFVNLAMDSGLLYFNLAFESGSKRLLRELKKSEKIVDNAKQIMNWIREKNDLMYCIGFFMFGFANETWDDVYTSMEFMKGLDLDWYQVNMLQVFKGTDLYDDYKKNGNIGKIKDAHYLSSTVENSIIPANELNAYIQQNLNIGLNFLNNRTLRKGNFLQCRRDMQHILNITNNEHSYAKKIMEVLGCSY